MSIEVSKQQREAAVASIRQYAERNLEEPMGELAAGLLLDFFLQDIGPVVYDNAVSDVQARLQARTAELDGELYEAPFTYWQQQASKRSRSR